MLIIVAFLFIAAVAEGILNKDDSPLEVMDGTLMFTTPVTTRAGLSTVNEAGYFEVMSKLENFTFSMDVGVNRGRVMVDDWLSKMPNVFVIGIEANHHLVANFEFGQHDKTVRERAFIVPAAISLKRGFARFNIGTGFRNGALPDVGSLFGWTNQNYENERLKNLYLQQVVRLIRADDILKHVPLPRPPSFLWDTLKIDVQGSDVEALISTGDFLKHFVCVVGEFQYNEYNIPKDVPTDPAPTLKDAGFVKVYHGETLGSNQVWMNSKLFIHYETNPERFGCHRVYDSLLTPQQVITEYKRLQPQ